MIDMTTESSAASAQKALDAINGHSLDRHPEDRECDFVDLLADLMHLADELKYDFQSKLDTAIMHYEGEVGA